MRQGTDFLRGNYSIVGIGEVAPPRGTYYPSYWGMAAEAAHKALSDAGLTKKDVDGVVFFSQGAPMPLPTPVPNAAYFCEYTGIGPAWYQSHPHGGMPFGAAGVVRAAFGIATGQATTVLVVGTDNFLSRLGRNGAVSGFASRASDPQYEGPYGAYPAALLAMIARRHMYEYGTTSEQLAAVAVAERKWAMLNPLAQMRSPITVEDVLNSRIIASPLHLLDTCLVSDGGAAVVVTTSERARDLKNKPVQLLGFGESARGRYLTALPSLADLDMVGMAASKALRMAGLKAQDIDMVYPYDPSTISVIFQLEQMGFCKKGEGGSFVEGGRIEPEGELPVNTHGGLHSCRHSSVAGPSFHLTEAVKQLRGSCGERQVKDAKLAMLSSEGGWFNFNVTVLGTT